MTPPSRRPAPVWTHSSRVRVLWQSLVGVEDSLRVQQGFDLSHQSHRLAGFTVADVLPFLQAQPVFGADAAPVPGRPLVDKGLDGGQQAGVFGRGGDVQVEVPVS